MGNRANVLGCTIPGDNAQPYGCTNYFTGNQPDPAPNQNQNALRNTVQFGRPSLESAQGFGNPNVHERPSIDLMRLSSLQANLLRDSIKQGRFASSLPERSS